ncbi:MAG: maleylpyruvate isomerase N-terminal domain-containing protein [Chloroflexi bacterium]|nr:maleylpyruvate isomerase N-terminal domain-containing protein [Chloroflexota bacterium]
MATREAIVQAIRNADARGEALRERIIAAPEAPLPEGDWNVRDTLSHLAARANPLPLIEMVTAMAESGAEPPPDDGGEAMNAQQIAERAGMSAAEILDEMHAAYEEAVTGIDGLDDETLARPVKLPIMPDEIQMSDLVLMSMTMHVEAHLGEIEAALDTAGA